MFDALPDCWTPVLTSDSLGDGPVGLSLAGERVVVFRGTDGVGALLDRCPHRGVMLSLGRVESGVLECPFHGWRFDRAGACVHVPFNPKAKRELLGATAIPVREAGGLVWVFTGEVSSSEPAVPEALTRPAVRIATLVEDWKCHWTRAMENMLDVPHLPFVHRATIGRGMRKVMRDASTLHQEVTPTDTGFELRFRVDGEARDGVLHWLRPNGMQLHILDGDDDSRLVRLHVWCVPTEPGQTRMIVAAAQRFGILTPLLFVGDAFNRKIIGEDREVVESSLPAEVPPAGDERSVATDAATLRFRAWYDKNIRQRDG